jgi:hypothetical protein
MVRFVKGDTSTMSKPKPSEPQSASSWRRIPDGTKVKHRHEGQEGFIDGTTELVIGPHRNPDGKTQYRMNVGTPARQLVTEDDLCILLDTENLVIMAKQKEPYRRSITEQLRGVFAEDRFIRFMKPA